MNGIDSCPGNARAAAEASSRLGCGRDEYGNDQYICVPNDSKTALLEFCHDRIISPVLAGEWLNVNHAGDICRFRTQIFVQKMIVNTICLKNLFH
jgi:hypothetical protein